jgi:hypothetical protein
MVEFRLLWNIFSITKYFLSPLWRLCHCISRIFISFDEHIKHGLHTGSFCPQLALFWNFGTILRAPAAKYRRGTFNAGLVRIAQRYHFLLFIEYLSCIKILQIQFRYFNSLNWLWCLPYSIALWSSPSPWWALKYIVLSIVRWRWNMNVNEVLLTLPSSTTLW